MTPASGQDVNRILGDARAEEAGTMATHRIITCEEWGAVPPNGSIVSAGRPTKIIFHHTAGHHPELDHKPTE